MAGWQDAPVIDAAQPKWAAAPTIDAPAAQPQQPTNRLMDAVNQRLSTMGRRTIKGLGDTFGGIATGEAAGLPGMLGNVESAARSIPNIAGMTMGQPFPVSANPVAKTSTELQTQIAGEPTSRDAREGRVIGDFLSGGAYTKGVKAIGQTAGFLAKHGLGLTTGAGAPAIGEAFKSGMAGGQRAETFAQNMRGQTPHAEVVSAAKDAVAELRRQKSEAYRAGIGSTIKGDPEVLDFAPVDQAIRDAAKVGAYKGKSLSTSAEKVWKTVESVIDDWRQSDPAQFHTPEGLDALKRKLGDLGRSDLADATKPGSIGKVILDGSYNAVKAQIAKQAPGYAHVMRDYTAASEELRNIEDSMSLGKKALTDTSLRKLQSIMRNNANTNYGARVQMGDRLNEVSGGDIVPALAGQQLNDIAPRGLGRVVAGGAAAGSWVNPMLLPSLALTSPRLAGEAAHGLGKVAGPLGRRLSPSLQQPAIGASGGADVANDAAIQWLLKVATPQMLARLLAAQPAQTN